MTTAYLGPKGTFTHFASTHVFHDSDIIPAQSLDQLFDGLNQQLYSAIFCPFENSIEGCVNRVLDNLLRTDGCFIQTMVGMQINQQVLAKNVMELSSIRHIVSMPVAIAQCYAFIKKHCPNATLHHSTSTAAAVELMEGLGLPESETVIIGPKQMAQFFPLIVIAKDIQDIKQNTTYFCTIQHDQVIPDTQLPLYATIACSTEKDEPGSLMQVLSVFSQYGINLTKILSRPSQNDLGGYIFYIECELQMDVHQFEEVLTNIQSYTVFFKHLGYYNKIMIHD